MRRSAQPAGKQANPENEDHKKPNANNDRSKEKVTNIATMDNGTMVEAFKYLNYCQLSKNSLVAKRFRNLIQTHRHSLALLYVDAIVMHSSIADPAVVKIFDKDLSPEAYNEWVIRNEYSKKVPLQDQVANTQNIPNAYRLYAYAHYDDPNHRECDDITTVFSARVEFNDDNWPLFQHFVRLLTDPFIYIDSAQLAYQIDVLNVLSRAINSDNDRLQCNRLNFDLNGTSQKSITWAKDHVRCNQFFILGRTDLNQDEAFLDFVVTGGRCTRSIRIRFHDLSKVMVDFVQKFIDLKNADECQLVEAIQGKFNGPAAELFMHDYAEFLVKEEIKDDDECTEQIFEFLNNNIGKKLQLTFENDYYMPDFSIKINNL